MKAILCLLTGLSATPAFAQTRLNLPLKRELDSLLVQDQKYRAVIGPQPAHVTDSLATTLQVPKDQVTNQLITRMLLTDSSDSRRVSAIVRRYGYPGKSLVGTPTNEAVWYVIQHSNKIAAYLPLIKATAERGELPYYLYAKMLDRQLMYEGREQLYGTQGRSYNILNKSSGQREMTIFIWPIKDANQVNERRKKAGFPDTVEENAARLHIPYKAMTLEQAKKLELAAQGN